MTTLAELRDAAEREGPWETALGEIGLFLHAPRPGGSRCSPINALAFAGAGGDGVHFSLLAEADAPVVMTVPKAAAGQQNHVVGATLHEFLCLGMFRGYLAMEQLAYARAEAIEQFAIAGFGPDEDQRHRYLLRTLAERLGLQPWRNVSARLAELRLQWFARLSLPR